MNTSYLQWFQHIKIIKVMLTFSEFPLAVCILAQLSFSSVPRRKRNRNVAELVVKSGFKVFKCFQKVIRKRVALYSPL